LKLFETTVLKWNTNAIPGKALKSNGETVYRNKEKHKRYEEYLPERKRGDRSTCVDFYETEQTICTNPKVKTDVLHVA
jgi:hypothetical protein